MTSALRTLWYEPRAANPPARVWRDWVLVGVLAPTALLEGIFREDIVLRPLAVAVGVALVFTLLWRRTHPLLMVVLVFGSFVAADIARLIAGEESIDLYSSAFVLILVYALFRWGSGRGAGAGLIVMFSALVLGLITDYSGLGDAIGGTIVLLFPGVLGLSVRYQRTTRVQEMEQVKLREREQLARELHDTVAHHVSAIAIQAQAGRVLAKASSLDGAADALEVIEEEASRTLVEMRSMIGLLRDGDVQPEMAPQRGIAGIAELATSSAQNSPRIDVELSGDLADLRPSLEAAMYRLAQESVTNAMRHARNATCVEVRLDADAETIRLTVSDNGDLTSNNSNSVGYGLVGMTERAALLGGTLKAGPGPNRGWTVQAVLPREGDSA